MSKAIRHMRQDSRQDNRAQRRSDREQRQGLNDRLKDKGLSWLERRRVIRNKRKIQRVRRRIDRKGDKAEIKQARLREKVQRLDRRVETPAEKAQQNRRPVPALVRPVRSAAAPAAPASPVSPAAAPYRSAFRPVRPGVPALLLPPPEADLYPEADTQRRLPGPLPLWRRPGFLQAPPNAPVPVLPNYGPSPEQWETFEDAYNATFDRVDPNGDADGVDLNPYDTEELIDVDHVDFMGEFAGEFAGDINTFLSRPRFSGVELSGDIIEAAIEGVGQARLNQLAEIAGYDGWSKGEYLEVAGLISDAVKGLKKRVKERREDGKGLLAWVDTQREAMAERREASGEDREQRRADNRANGPERGVLNAEDGTWGPSTNTANVLIRARRGMRAAVVDLPGGFSLVRAMGAHEDPNGVTQQIQALVAAVQPAVASVVAPAVPALAGPEFGCGGNAACGCNRNRWGV